MRAFLAVPVAEPALTEVATLLDRLGREVGRVRWARPDGVHVTVRFLGEVEEADAFNALEAVRPVAAATPRFPVALGGLGRFPPRGPARVLWIGVADGLEPLAGLVARCADSLERIGVTREVRPFRGHCTLGRPRDPWPTGAVRAWDRQECPPLTPFLADRVTLFESRPGPGGAVYTPRGAALLAD